MLFIIMLLCLVASFILGFAFFLPPISDFWKKLFFTFFSAGFTFLTAYLASLFINRLGGNLSLPYSNFANCLLISFALMFTGFAIRDWNFNGYK